MIDIVAILVSTLCVLFVLVRAITLDRTLPWFEDAEQKAQAGSESAGARGAQRPPPF